jgi:8-oxo-dGTP pyrophosphatase MutT (NUDIX family)
MADFCLLVSSDKMKEMDLKSSVDSLKLCMTQPLPGKKAQLGLLSEKSLQDYENRFKNLGSKDDVNTTRQSSVCILLYEKEGSIFFPLIKRPEYEGVHSGQIALPGGKVEEDDADITATALRETYEEIGIPVQAINVLGLLTPVFIPPSRFWVNVVLAYTEDLPDFIADPHEVEEVIEYPLALLLEGKNTETREVMGATDLKMKVPGYVYQGHFIWGATSMILTELRALVK